MTRARRSLVAIAGLASAAACAHRSSPPAIHAAAHALTPALPQAPSGPVEIDRGELTLTTRGRRSGSEAFTIERDRDGYVIRSEVRLESGSTLRLFDSVLVTDDLWRPRAGSGRDVKDGGTTVALAGAPLTLTSRARLGPTTVRTASRAVELFLGDNTFAHFAPTCAPAAPTPSRRASGCWARPGRWRG